MVTQTYGFQKDDLTVAIAAADDLARRYRDGTARRVHADGSIDLVAMEGSLRRSFLLYRVSSEGRAALVERTAAPAAHGSAVAMMFIGIAVFAASILSVILHSDRATPRVGLAVAGFIVSFVGIIRANRFDLTWYLRKTFGTDSGWQQLFAPTGWAPRTAGQLRAVERLADEHGGKALARPHYDGGTEVRTLKRGRLHEHLVAPDGTIRLVGRGKRAPLYILGTATMAIGVGGMIWTTVLYQLIDLDTGTAFGVSFGLFTVGAALGAMVTLEKAAGNRADGIWHLVQTKADDPG